MKRIFVAASLVVNLFSPLALWAADGVRPILPGTRPIVGPGEAPAPLTSSPITAAATAASIESAAAPMAEGVQAVMDSAGSGALPPVVRQVAAERLQEGIENFKIRAAVPVEGAPGVAPNPTLAAIPEGVPQKRLKDGSVHPLSYYPDAPRPSLLRRAARAVAGLPRRIGRTRAFMRRVDQLMSGISDENLAWSLGRLDSLSTQEGILRANNVPLINPWEPGDSIRRLSSADFSESSLTFAELARIFKAAMDLEEPAAQYAYSFAQNLHNRHPRMSHFLGTTLQERILAVALKGKAGQRAIWVSEEARHGPILEKVYNLVRDESVPPLFQQGTAPRLPRDGGEYLARSGMSNRSSAEISAASAYLTIKANAAAGSPVDVALDGIFRDEVYHYVIMAAVNRFVYGYRSRFGRIFRIIRHEFDYPVPEATDAVIHRGLPISLWSLMEIFYAYNAVDKRIDTYLRGLDPAKVKATIGPFYRTDAEIDAAVARGEHNWTRRAVMEQNPDLSLEDVQGLARRFPTLFSVDRRVIARRDIEGVVANYRATSLRNPNYWMRKKAFEAQAPEDGAPVIARRLMGGSEARIRFPVGRSPEVEILGPAGEKVYAAAMDAMSMLQIGVLMDATGGIVGLLEANRQDLSPQEISNRLSRISAYQKAPIPVSD